jgi:hypothetical protein
MVEVNSLRGGPNSLLEFGRKAIDPHKMNNLTACSLVIFFRSPENCHPARDSFFTSVNSLLNLVYLEKRSFSSSGSR